MNALENFCRMMEGRNPERMPFELPTTPPVADLILRKTGKNPTEAFDLDMGNSLWIGDPDGVGLKWRKALEKIGFEFPPHSHVGNLGFAHITPSKDTLGSATHLTQMLHPYSVVESVEQLEQLPWPNLGERFQLDHQAANVAYIHRQGKIAVAHMECTVFESAWYLRGMDNLFCDWAEHNEVGDWLLDYFMNRSIYAGKVYATAGYDLIRLGDDVGTQQKLLMSIDTWRTHLKPRLKNVIDAIRAASPRKVWIQYHSDGNILDLVGDLIEIGVDVLNPMQPECMDIETVIEKYKKCVAFSGMIGTQTTMPFGTPADVRSAVNKIAELHRHGARVIISPTHVLEPDVPWENILAFVEEVRSIRF